MHGGSSGSGAPVGEKNGAYQHGGYTPDAVALRRQASALMRRVAGGMGEDDPPMDEGMLALLLDALANRKLTREEKRARNKAAWACRDRRKWGGEDRRGWPKRPGRNGYKGMV